MGFLLLLAGAAALTLVAPRAADALAALVTFGFLVPAFALAGGTVAWSIGILCGLASWSVASWFTCVLCFGGPLGLATAAVVMK